MPGLTTSLDRATGYKLGGAHIILLLPSLLTNGTAGFVVTRTSGAISNIVPDAGAPVQRVTPEEGEASWKEDLVAGANRFVKQSLTFKVGGWSDANAAALKQLNLYRHAAIIKQYDGTCILIGETSGLLAEANAGGSGAKNEDFAGSEVTLSGADTVHAAIVPLSLFNTLAASVAD